jgi:hypothetical protein
MPNNENFNKFANNFANFLPNISAIVTFTPEIKQKITLFITNFRHSIWAPTTTKVCTGY